MSIVFLLPICHIRAIRRSLTTQPDKPRYPHSYAQGLGMAILLMQDLVISGLINYNVFSAVARLIGSILRRGKYLFIKRERRERQRYLSRRTIVKFKISEFMRNCMQCLVSFEEAAPRSRPFPATDCLPLLPRFPCRPDFPSPSQKLCRRPQTL